MKAMTIGGAMVDSIAIIDDARIERMQMRNAEASYLLVEEGRKIEAREISQHCGGGAVNAAISMARLGCDVSTVLKLGQDQRAEMILRRLDAEGVSTRWAMRDPRDATGAAVMVAAHDRDAAIFTFRGANTLLRASDLKPDMFGVDLVYITKLSNEAADCFPDIIAMAAEAGAKVAANPGVRQLNRYAEPFQENLGRIDILSINRAEAEALVPQLAARFGEGGPPLEALDGREPPELARRGLHGGGYEMSLPHFASALRQSGVGQVLVTDGGHGAFAASAERIHFCPTLKVEVAGTAGAGDAFASTFSALIAEGADPADALRAATLNAGSVIGYVDTQTGLLERATLEMRLAEQADDLPVMVWPVEG